MIRDRVSNTMGVVTREAWDDTTNTYTKTDGAGNILQTRAFTAAELQYVTDQATAKAAASAAATNQTTLTAKASNALTGNATFLAIASPNNAQTLAQVQALTRQMNALIRLSQGILDTTTGT